MEVGARWSAVPIKFKVDIRRASFTFNSVDR